MTIQEKIDQLQDNLKNIKEHHQYTCDQILRLSKQIEELKESENKMEAKPTRYYPNGAYMDEPEKDTKYWYIGNEGEFWLTGYFEGSSIERFFLGAQNLFPTEEAAEKELKRQKLTAKMYRDMRDERINGDWVLDWNDFINKYYPHLHGEEIKWNITSLPDPHNFYYKNESFIEDLKALGWTEEELKIVWFNN